MESKVTIRYDRNTGFFRGSVRSERNFCERGRRVVAKKQRKGRDATVGRDRTSRNGAWRVGPERRADGRYYAKARKKTVTKQGRVFECRGDRSKTIRV